MINLNLISPQQKYHLEERRRHFICENLIILIFLLTFIIALGLSFSKYLILNNYQQLILEKTDQNLSGINQEIRELNNKLELMADIQAEYNPVAEKLAFFANLVPENIFITNLELEKKEDKDNIFWLVSIRGKAKTREDLTNFQSTLNQTNGFSETEYPLSNLLKKTDIDFQFTAKLDNSVP